MSWPPEGEFDLWNEMLRSEERKIRGRIRGQRTAMRSKFLSLLNYLCYHSLRQSYPLEPKPFESIWSSHTSFHVIPSLWK